MVVIPCSREKRWHDEPDLGPSPASLAYTSPLHREAQRVARASGGTWVILSALHGLLRPDDLIPANYDVTFSRPDDPVISTDALAAQALALGLVQADHVLSLCPADYTERIRAAVGTTHVDAPLDGIALDDLDAMTRRIQALAPVE